MNFKKLKLLAKLATSALAVNAIGLGAQVSAMEHDASSAEVLLQRALVYLNDTKKSYLQNLLVKIEFIAAIEGCLAEYYKNGEYHTDFYRDLEYSVRGDVPDNQTDYTEFEKDMSIFKTSWDVIHGRVKEYFEYLTKNFSKEQLTIDGTIENFLTHYMKKLVYEYNKLVVPNDQFGDLTTNKEHLLKSLLEYFFGNKNYSNRCPICLCDTTPTQNKIILRCGHIFHNSCYKQFDEACGQLFYVNCPLCKKMNNKPGDIRVIPAKSVEVNENDMKPAIFKDITQTKKRRANSVKK